MNVGGRFKLFHSSYWPYAHSMAGILSFGVRTVARKADRFSRLGKGVRDYRLSRERPLENKRIRRKPDSFSIINNQDSLKLRTISRRSGRLPYISR